MSRRAERRMLSLGLALGLSIGLSSTAQPNSAQLVPSLTPSPQLTATNLPLQRADWNSGFAQLGLDDQWSQPNSRAALIRAIDYSLRYLQTPAAVAAYQRYPISTFSREQVRRSLERFRQLVLTTSSAASLQAALQQEFNLYQSIGADGQGTVSFTGYFEPVYPASSVPTAEFRYPLYRLPPNLSQWQPQPTRLELEGADGLRGQGKLRGLGIAWLRNRLDAYLVQVQGSARLQMQDGSTLSIGAAGHTDYPYTSIGRELVQAGKIAAADLTLEAVKQYFQQYPQDLDIYLPRNNRFVFFQQTAGAPATGSLNVPVTAGRSIATDKTLMPPAALALIQTELPDAQGNIAPVQRFVLDQDTGGAIRGAGRVDLFMGSGATAGKQAGLINHKGQLYYLLLK